MFFSVSIHSQTTKQQLLPQDFQGIMFQETLFYAPPSLGFLIVLYCTLIMCPMTFNKILFVLECN